MGDLIFKPASGGDLILQEDGGSAALTINTDGNTVIADGNRIQTDEVRAYDGAGLKLYDDGGSGIFVKDGGSVGILTATPDHILEVEQSGSTVDEYAGNFKTTQDPYNLQVESTHNNVTGTQITSYHNSAAPADGDFAGAYKVHCNDSDGTRILLGDFGWLFDDVTAGTIDSHMRFRVFENGTQKFPTLTAAGVWTDASAEASKEYEGTRQEIWPDGILAKVKVLKISKYHDANQPADKPITETHVSPSAEDFYDTLQIGIDPRAIKKNKDGENTGSPTLAAKDLGGVALVAIQELLERLEVVEDKLLTL